MVRGAAIATEARINDRIRANQVRLIGEDGEQIGVMPVGQALAKAEESGLDLVEVAPQADPPVCRLMDYGKWKYEQELKRRESRKKRSHDVVKGMRFRPKTSSHDYETKLRKIEEFLKDGYKVKAMVWFRGREVFHPELGTRILDKLASDLSGIASVESTPKLDDRNMVMLLAPTRRSSKQSRATEDDGDEKS